MAIAVTQLILFDREGISRCFGEFFFKGTLRVTPNCSIFFTYNCGVLLQKKRVCFKRTESWFSKEGCTVFLCSCVDRITVELESWNH